MSNFSNMEKREMESFYNRNAEDYFQKTWKLDLKEIYGKFLRYVPSGGKILDVGCGSGRDAYHFSQAGYAITALDDSTELINRVRSHVDCEVQHSSFYDFNEKNIYDGIWCCASLLHCAENKLEDVLHSLILGLKPLGILYMSYKVGEGIRYDEDRFFLDMNECKMSLLIGNLQECYLLQQWITVDKKPNSNEEWLNVLIQKKMV